MRITALAGVLQPGDGARGGELAVVGVGDDEHVGLELVIKFVVNHCAPVVGTWRLARL